MTDYKESGLKKTKQRECVFSVLQNAEKPLTAFEIYKEAENDGSGPCLSTVYRILELLESKGVVTKNIITGDDKASYGLCKKNHKHYAVCISCRKKIQMQECPLKNINLPGDFHVTGHKVEMLGYCDLCYKEKEEGQ